MPNYKELYFKLFRANEKAIKILIQAQQECEELYLSEEENIRQLNPLPHDRD